MDLLDIVSASHASYLMTGKNSFRDGFQVPFISKLNGDGTARGHELMNEFIRFFNDPRTIFACHQKNLLTADVPKVQVLAAEEMGGIVDTVVSSATARRLAQTTGDGQTILLQPAKGAGFHPSGSKLTIKASDLALLAETGAAVKIDGPIAGISITNEGAHTLSGMGEEVSFTARRTKDVVEVLVCVDDTRLTYIPGGLDTEVYTEADPSTTVRLVTAKTPFPYGDPMKMLLGMAAASWTESGKYTAVFDVQNGTAESWSIYDSKGNILMSGSALEEGTIQIDGGKTLSWSLESGEMSWSIAENGKTILTGSAPMSIPDQKTQSLFGSDETVSVEDGRYLLTVETENGKVVKWSAAKEGGKTVLTGTELSTAPQIDPGDISFHVNGSGTAVSVHVNGSAKLKISSPDKES